MDSSLSRPSTLTPTNEDEEEEPSYLYGGDVIDASFGWSESSMSAIDDASSSDSSGMQFQFPSLLFPTGRFRSFGENLTVVSNINRNGPGEGEEEKERPIFDCSRRHHDDCDTDDDDVSDDKEKTFLSLSSFLSSKSQRGFLNSTGTKIKPPCTSADFSFAKILGACSEGVGGGKREGKEGGRDHSSIRADDDDEEVPNDVLSWMQEKMELVASLATGDDINPRSRKKVQHEWGTKPTLEEMSTSDSSRDTIYRNFLFVDNESTSWEATDNDDSIFDEFPRPGYRKTDSISSSTLGQYSSSLLPIERNDKNQKSRHRPSSSPRFQPQLSTTTTSGLRPSRNKIRNQIPIIPPSPPRQDFAIVRDHRNKTEKPTKAEI